MASRYGLCALVLSIACAGAVAPAESLAQAPPAGSPAALGQHPRLFFTRTDIPVIRGRLAEHYRTEFQRFLDMLENPESLESKVREIVPYWGSMNYAFVAAMGPTELQGLGFNLPSRFDTAPELCGQAMTYARTRLADIAAAREATHDDLTTGYNKAIFMPVAAAYDWCFEHLPQSDKTAIADAFVAGFNKKYAGRNANRLEIKGLEMMANNQASSNIQDLAAMIVFWGDSYPAADVQASMYRYLDTIWLGRLMAELEVLYPQGANWHEGPGGYLEEGFVNISWGIAALSSALGRPLVAELPFYTRTGQWLLGMLKPMGLSSTCGDGSKPCPKFFERWGAMTSGIGMPSCRHLELATGLNRVYAPNSAPLVKWGVDTLMGGCDGFGVRFGGYWSNAVFYFFLFGDRGVTPRSPEQEMLSGALKHGLGAYSMKSGYGPDDTHVVFFAQPVNTYGHGTWNYGDFSLSKYGNLIVQAANRKSGDGVLDTVPSSGSLFRNVLTLHKGDNDVTLSVNGAGPVPAPLSKYGLTDIKGVGKVHADSLNFGQFEYVSYDNSQKWASTTATLSQREFVYLHGPENSEYLVLFDRFNAVKPSTDEKIWRIWVPNKPEFVNGAGSQPRPGKWTSSNSTLVSLTNRFGPMSASKFSTGPTNGRFFLRTILPQNPVINFLGGDNMEFQNGNDDGTTTWGAPTLTQAMREYLGWGRIEVRPSVAKDYDLFLNIVQFGRADQLNTPTSMVRIEAQGSMTGAHIRDTANEWLTLFATEGWPGSPRTATSYRYTPVSANAQHLLVNMQPSTPFYIKAEPVGSEMTITVATTATANAISVESTEGGVVRFSVAGGSIAVNHRPAAPRLREARVIGD